jgi:divalent metal cation (Fe/Co/Zn/Cd) transporter
VLDETLEVAPRADVRAGLAASTASIAWTAVTSGIAIGYGVAGGSLVLVAFGAVGVFDMAGSITLVVHFRHTLRHQAISAGHERVAQLVVSLGMLTVGVATLVASGVRLSMTTDESEPIAGIITSAASILALGYLGTRKRRIGARIPSRALITDGWLSLTGCATATCAVAGLGLADAFGWTWVDPLAAMGIAAIAITIGAVSLRRAAKPRRTPLPRGR